MNSIFVENIYIAKLFLALYALLEIYMNKHFFIHVFNLSLDIKKVLAFFFTCFSFILILILILPYFFIPFIDDFIIFTCILLFFPQNFLRSTFTLVVPTTIFQMLKLIVVFVTSIISGLSPISLLRVPATIFLFIMPLHSCIHIFLVFINKFKLKLKNCGNLNLHNMIFIILFSAFGFSSTFVTIYSIFYLFSDTNVLFLSMIIACNLFFLVGIYMLIYRTIALQVAKKFIVHEKNLYNNLSSSYESVREFKHDFSNIMQSIGGYLCTNDFDGLKSYYSSVFKECSILNKSEILNKDVLNSPPILALLTEKFYKAKEINVEFNIEVFTDLTKLNMDIYEFTRILGIFLDNSIEAASNSSNKLINILITKDRNKNCDYLIIENSCSENCIDTEKIFDKNFTTKPHNTGIGLWKVKKILNKNKNVLLNTSVENNVFRHKLTIYY